MLTLWSIYLFIYSIFSLFPHCSIEAIRQKKTKDKRTKYTNIACFFSICFPKREKKIFTSNKTQRIQRFNQNVKIDYIFLFIFFFFLFGYKINLNLTTWMERNKEKKGYKVLFFTSFTRIRHKHLLLFFVCLLMEKKFFTIKRIFAYFLFSFFFQIRFESSSS